MGTCVVNRYLARQIVRRHAKVADDVYAAVSMDCIRDFPALKQLSDSEYGGSWTTAMRSARRLVPPGIVCSPHHIVRVSVAECASDTHNGRARRPRLFFVRFLLTIYLHRVERRPSWTRTRPSAWEKCLCCCTAKGCWCSLGTRCPCAAPVPCGCPRAVAGPWT